MLLQINTAVMSELSAVMKMSEKSNHHLLYQNMGLVWHLLWCQRFLFVFPVVTNKACFLKTSSSQIKEITVVVTVTSNANVQFLIKPCWCPESSSLWWKKPLSCSVPSSSRARELSSFLLNLQCLLTLLQKVTLSSDFLTLSPMLMPSRVSVAASGDRRLPPVPLWMFRFGELCGEADAEFTLEGARSQTP